MSAMMGALHLQAFIGSAFGNTITANLHLLQ